MDKGFWIGLVLAIPLSVLANVLTPSVQAWVDTRSRKKSLKRTTHLRRDFERIKEFRANRQTFYEYLLGAVLKALYIGALIAIFSGVCIAIPNLRLSGALFNEGMYILAQAFTAIGSVVVVKICGDALRDVFKVREFETYKSSVQNNIGEELN